VAIGASWGAYRLFSHRSGPTRRAWSIGLGMVAAGLDAVVEASPGQHTLTAEFVAIDHAPFQPRVRATVTFSVSG
jgi:hypothetical protein